MNKNVLIICSSPRKGGNSDTLADAFAKGAAQNGNTVEIIYLSDYKLGYCKACYYCQKHLKCVQKDGADELMDKLTKADTVVFTTPIYFYEMSGQLKVFLDRTMPVYFSGYTFHDVYLLATSAENNKSAMDGAIKGLQGWIDCYDNARLAGVVYGIGCDVPGAIQHHPEVLEEAYHFGKQI